MKYKILRITKRLVEILLLKEFRWCHLASLVMNVDNWPQVELTNAKSSPVKSNHKLTSANFKRSRVKRFQLRE